MPRGLPQQITIAEAAQVSGFSARSILRFSTQEPLCRARSKGQGRGAKVTLDREAFRLWMEARRSVRATVPA